MTDAVIPSQRVTAVSGVVRYAATAEFADPGPRPGALLTALCSDPDTADQVLTYLLATAATLPDEPSPDPVDVDCHLTTWEPVVAAVATAATTGHSPTELTEALDQLGASPDWVTLVAALRRVLAGERDHDRLIAGLDDVDTAILTATLDRLPTDPGEEP